MCESSEGIVFQMSASSAFPNFRFERSFEIPGLKSEASAITFSPVTGNLLVVADEPSSIVEFTTEGELVRKVKLKGFKDTEGLCHLDGHQFAIVEERKKRITWMEDHAVRRRHSRAVLSQVAGEDCPGADRRCADSPF